MGSSPEDEVPAHPAPAKQSRNGKPSREALTQQTPKGYAIPLRKREDVLRDFRKIVAPLRGRSRPKG